MPELDYNISTDRFELKLLSLDDSTGIWPYVSDPEISKLMSWDAHSNISETENFIRGVEENFKKGKAISWGIHFNNEIIGVFSIISILRSHRSLTFDKAELAYWLGPDYQGNGIMTEVGEQVLNFGFTQLHLNKIYVGHHNGNRGSKGLIERLKFKHTHIEKEAFRKDGEWIDVSYYSMLKKEYLELYKL
jgi:[ribosomal protein S5]-alanine N-acetyltransferase